MRAKRTRQMTTILIKILAESFPSCLAVKTQQAEKRDGGGGNSATTARIKIKQSRDSTELNNSKNFCSSHCFFMSVICAFNGILWGKRDSVTPMSDDSTLWVSGHYQHLGGEKTCFGSIGAPTATRSSAHHQLEFWALSLMEKLCFLNRNWKFYCFDENRADDLLMARLWSASQAIFCSRSSIKNVKTVDLQACAWLAFTKFNGTSIETGLNGRNSTYKVA